MSRNLGVRGTGAAIVDKLTPELISVICVLLAGLFAFAWWSCLQANGQHKRDKVAAAAKAQEHLEHLVLMRLRVYPDESHHLEHLARDLGVDRSELGRILDELSEGGAVIADHDRDSYRLVPDLSLLLSYLPTVRERRRVRTLNQ